MYAGRGEARFCTVTGPGIGLIEWVSGEARRAGWVMDGMDMGCRCDGDGNEGERRENGWGWRGIGGERVGKLPSNGPEQEGKRGKMMVGGERKDKLEPSCIRPILTIRAPFPTHASAICIHHSKLKKSDVSTLQLTQYLSRIIVRCCLNPYIHPSIRYASCLPRVRRD